MDQLKMRLIKTIKEYSENCTIHGVGYIFARGQQGWERILWVVVVITGIVLATLFSSELFIAWSDFPLITSVATTDFPVENLPWPSITVCSQGRGIGATERVYNLQLSNFVKEKGKVIENLNEAEKKEEERMFLQNNYPGLTEIPTKLVTAITSADPDRVVEADVLGNELFECNEHKTIEEECNAAGYRSESVEHSGGSSCYDLAVIDPPQNFVSWTERCQRAGGRLLDLTTEFEFLSVADQVNEKVWISGCQAAGNAFRWQYIHSKSDNVSEELLACSDGEYIFVEGFRKERDMSWIRFNTTNDPTLETWVDEIDGRKDTCFYGEAKTDENGTKYFDIHKAHCTLFVLGQSICEKTLEGFASPEQDSGQNNDTLCTSERSKRDISYIPKIDLYLNPTRRIEREVTLMKQKNTYKKKMSSLDPDKSFNSMFELLWYSGNPCFDLINLTSERLHQKSVIKQCMWKGEQVSCSRIFRMTPTDKGMCCKFGLKNNDKMFIENNYQNNLARLQNQDKRNAYDRLWNEGNDDIDSKSEMGRSKGLVLVLDAHSDLLAERSVEEDSKGFLVGITQSGEFPLMGQGAHLLKPGNEHFLSLSAVDTISDGEIKSYLKPAQRKCYFPDEKHLKFHTQYSQSACMFECGLSIARTTSKLDCLPWYFPNIGTQNYSAICDPWDTRTFMQALRNTTRSDCPDCLSDCRTTTFSLSISSALLRECTELNNGLSSLCRYSSRFSPSLASKKVLEEYSHMQELPDYVKRFKYEDSARRVLSSGVEYDAFKEDIAVVHVYWDTPSVLQFQRALRLTWVDYLAQVWL